MIKLCCAYTGWHKSCCSEVYKLGLGSQSTSTKFVMATIAYLKVGKG